MKKKVAVSMQVRKKVVKGYNNQMPKWFYAFVPFKIATGGSSQVIPLYAIHLGAGAGEVGLLNAFSTLSSTVGTVFWGKLSDKTLKRKIFILMGLLSVSIFLSLLSFARDFWDLLAINAVYSFFLASTVSIPIVLLFRNVRKTRWDEAVGRFNKIGGWAWVLGLLAGFALVKFLSFRQLLLFFAIANVPGVIMALRTIREAPVYLHRNNIKPFVTQVIQKSRYLPNFIIHMPTKLKVSPKFAGFYLSSAFFWISSGMYVTQLPVYLINNGLTGQEIFGLALLNSSTSAMLYQRVGLKLKSKNPALALIQGYFIRSLGALLLLFPLTVPYSLLISALGSYILMGYSWSYVSVSSTSLLGRMSSPKEQGSVLATANLINSGGFVLGSLAGGFVVSQVDFALNFAIASSMGLCAIVPVLGLIGFSFPLHTPVHIRRRN
ncbi:MFS transporter [Thermococcus aggregans]|uniref:MFS transporter n=1 Tax=Thermococcus aggregans TaxID=110163 RepID=A0A9E7MY73_THEAG|nr:MFS transporter [Thermococcus aggregans]USS41099.1 MFS transporter [Thermococcus aggregans]